MAKSLHIASALLTVALIPQTVGAQKVSYDYDRSANFSRLRSYALRQEKMSDNPLLDERIRVSIVGVLAGRGLTLTDHPDMYVVPSLSSETRKEVTAYNPGFGYGWYGMYPWYGPVDWHPYGWNWDGGWATYQVRDVQYATLTIDMLDGASGSLLWRGKGVRDVNPHWKPDTLDKKVHSLVAKILGKFPPDRN